MAPEPVLRGSERLVEALEAAGVGAFVYWIETDRVDWDAQVYRNMGVPLDGPPMNLERFFALVHPDDRWQLDQDLSRAMKQKAGYDIEYRVGSERAGWRWVAARSRFQTDGERSWLTGAIWDITARKQAEEEVRALSSELEERNAVLEASLRELAKARSQLLLSERLTSLGRLVAGIAHELNTPLGALTSSASTIAAATRKLEGAARTGPDSVSERLIRSLATSAKTAQAAAARISEVVSHLKVFSRLDQGEVESASLEEAANAVLELARTRLSAHRVERRYGFTAPRRMRIREIHQALLTLVWNAADALDRKHPEGGGTLVVRTGEGDGRRAWVDIEDDGDGLASDKLGQLLEPRVEQSSSQVRLRLGLPIAYRIAEEHGGTVELQSPGPGLGCRARLDIEGIRDG
ncbi:MAG: sensor histidine kinase [Myxococcota bacterium]